MRDHQQPQFTAIHRALGIEPSPIEWTLIAQAVDAGVSEQADLDWKRERYDSKPKWHDEFAKDVAAMANSGGGIIVLGVNEDRATSAATSFADTVDLSDADERMFRSTIYSRVFPPVAGVNFTRLTDNEHAVVIIRVPPSADAPHLIERQQLFGAPFRDGTRTEWMHERQLAAAYRSRYAGALALEERVAALYEEVTYSTYPDLRVCFVAVAMPENPRPAVLRRVNRDQAWPILQDALSLRARLCQDGIHPLRDTGGDLSNPRQGLRRQTSRYDHEDGNPKHRSALGSIHDDGSVSMAWSLGGMLQQSTAEPQQLSARFVEAAAADFVALVGSTIRGLGVDSRYELKAGLVWNGAEPILMRLPDLSLGGYDRDAEDSIPIKKFVPAWATLSPAPSDEDLLAAARDLALDCVSQAGATGLSCLHQPAPTTW